MIAKINEFLVFDEMLSDVTDRTSLGRLFQSHGSAQAVANERSPTVTHHDVADVVYRLGVSSADRSCTALDPINTAVP